MLMLTLALRNILRNKRRTLLTMLSLFGGYVLLALSLSVQTGSYEQAIAFFTQDSTGHVQITAPGYQEKPTLYKTLPSDDAFYDAVSGQPEVVKAAPRIIGAALAYGEVKSFPVQLLGVDVSLESELSYIRQKISSGNYFSAELNSDGFYSAMIGSDVAQQLQLGVGDELVLISQGSDGSIANDLYEITAIIGKPGDGEARKVYLPLLAAQEFFVLEGKAHAWVLLTDHHRNALELAESLNQQSEFKLFEVASWQVVADEFYRTMQADIEGGYISYYIIVFLVSIGVLNTVLMSVMERTGEFGVLKAIGTSNVRVFLLIVIETLLLALLSCFVGSIVFLPLNYWLVTTGVAVPPQEVSGVVFDSMRGSWDLAVIVQPFYIIFFAALIVSFFPAMRAARIVPVDAMRQL